MECDLVAKAVVDGEARGYLWLDGKFKSDRSGELALSDAQLRALVGDRTAALTYTCVPPGAGLQLGLDRDGDGFPDRDELDAGSYPANPGDTPHGLPTPTASARPTPTPTPSPLPQFCPGDCDDDGSVTVDEIVFAVGIALGEQRPIDCPLADTNFDGAVTIDELLQGVNAVFGFCP
jgi:hypothetical protein